MRLTPAGLLGHWLDGRPIAVRRGSEYVPVQPCRRERFARWLLARPEPGKPMRRISFLGLVLMWVILLALPWIDPGWQHAHRGLISDVLNGLIAVVLVTLTTLIAWRARRRRR